MWAPREAPAAGVHLGLDPHPGVGKAADHHLGGGPNVAEAAAEQGPAWLEVVAVGEEMTHPDDVHEGAVRFYQRVFEVAEAADVMSRLRARNRDHPARRRS